MAEEIKKLTRTVCLLDDTEVSINHNLLLTMIDGKIVNAITNTKATQVRVPSHINFKIDYCTSIHCVKDNFLLLTEILHRKYLHINIARIIDYCDYYRLFFLNINIVVVVVLILFFFIILSMCTKKTA